MASIAAFALLCVAMLGLAGGGARSSRALALAWLWIACSPMGIRWLADGMETSLVAVLAVLLGRSAAAMQEPSDAAGPRRWFAAGAILAVLAVLCRIENLFIVVIAMVAAMSGRRWRLHPFGQGCAAGALLAVGVVFALFGHLLPDTAVAKGAQRAGLPAWPDAWAAIESMVYAHAGSSLFGIGTLTVLGASAFLLRRPWSRADVVVNACLPAFVVLAIVRLQVIQGYRYFASVEFSVVAYNIARFASTPAPAQAARPRAAPAALMACTAALLAWAASDAMRLVPISEGRSATWRKMRQMDWSAYAGREAVASDVGMIGYYSGAKIIDLSGLVNGRAFAALQPRDRLEAICRDRDRIAFVFAREYQKESLRCLPLSRWKQVAVFDFTNLKDPDRHELLVPP